MTHEPHPHALQGLRDLEQQLRGPDLAEGSPSGQMALSIVLPGLATIRRVPLLGIVLFVVGVAVPLVGVAWLYARRSDIVAIAFDPTFLVALIGVGLGAVVVRLLAIAEVSHAFRRHPGIGGRTFVATIVTLLLASPVLWATYRANEARAVVGDVFVGGSDEPLFVPTDGSAGGGDSGGSDEVTNVLLLGGDAGPGRWGLRTDTMIVVSIHEDSGRTALVSVPRNLTRLTFPPGTPLAAAFPDGFDDLANAVFPYVSTRPELMEHYGRDGLQAEAIALAEALGHSLSIEIDDFALVNMQGFTDVIDAVGGVTLDLAESVPLPPSLPGERPLPASVGPGVVDMDGAMAIAYARSRSADSDYQRMGRQRQLLAALGSQISPTDAVRAFGKVGTIGDSVRTSLTSGEFNRLLERLGDNSAIVESVGLTPPLIEPGSPDYAVIRTIMDAVESAVRTGQPSGYAG